MPLLKIKISECFAECAIIYITGFRKNVLAKQSTHSTTCQLKTIYNHSKADRIVIL